MTLDATDALVRALHNHNPWWEAGVDAFDLPPRQKSDFYYLARPDGQGSQFEDQSVLGIVGRRGVGKTTLLQQFIAQQLEAGAAPEQFLYLPFDADPLYQLQSDAQLRQAVRYYESRILGRSGTVAPQFVFLDDVHRIEHPEKPEVDGWGTPVTEVLAAESTRHVVVTASAALQVTRELDRVSLPATEHAVQPILPEKFRDYLFTLYPSLEADDTRISPSSLRSGDASIPTALSTGAIDPLVSDLRAKYEQVADVERQIQSQLVEYLSMGGVISYEVDGAAESVTDLPADAFHQLRADVRNTLYQEVPGLDSIRTLADLERLCALAAQNRGREPLRYQDLVDLFDVDRRTIADSYLPALAALYVLTGVTEYDNSRPRAVRLYLRDTGLVTALTDGDPAALRTDFAQEADLARIAGFDHTMRFAYGIQAAQQSEPAPTVQYWRGQDGTVAYVFEVNETPVPIGFAYRSQSYAPSRAALQEFMQVYDTPVGFLLTGDTMHSDRPIERLDDNIITLPYWLYLFIC